MIRTAICFWRLGPYHHARLTAAGRRMELNAIEFVASDHLYAWSAVAGEDGFTRHTLQPDLGEDQAGIPAGLRLLREALDRIQPEVVAIPGWSMPDALEALDWALQNRRPVVVLSESTAWDEPRRPWKEAIKRRVVSLCQAGLAGGTSHRDYLAQLGLPAERVALGYDVVDNAHFESSGGTKAESGLYFLASARFIPQKNLPMLLRAYARYRETAGAAAWPLVLLGDGPLRPELETLVRELGLEHSVSLPGFVQYEALPGFYAGAGAFVHPSTVEPWGLVVNEAMAAGLPVLVSRTCGCAADLVADGENGFLLDPADAGQIAGCLQQVSAPDFPRVRFGEASRRRIADWSPERFGAGLATACDLALAARPARATVVDRLLLHGLRRRRGAV